MINKSILEDLEKRGYVVYDMQKNPEQGAVSKVYLLKTNKGNLILHTGIISGDRELWDTVNYAYRLLKHHPRIPSAQVILAKRQDNKYFIVQEALQGKPLGWRIEQKEVIDTWYTKSRKLQEHLEEVIAKIHAIPLQGGGWLVSEHSGKSGDLVHILKNTCSHMARAHG